MFAESPEAATLTIGLVTGEYKDADLTSYYTATIGHFIKWLGFYADTDESVFSFLEKGATFEYWADITLWLEEGKPARVELLVSNSLKAIAVSGREEGWDLEQRLLQDEGYLYWIAGHRLSGAAVDIPLLLQLREEHGERGLLRILTGDKWRECFFAWMDTPSGQQWKAWLQNARKLERELQANGSGVLLSPTGTR